MAATPSHRWIPSSHRNPCPICGRTKDGDCRILSDDTGVICHHPRTDLSPGDVLPSGWAFTGNSDDGRGARFKRDEPMPETRERTTARRVVPLRRPAAAPRQLALARLPEPIAAPASPYLYSPTQRVLRIQKPGGKGKRFCCEHLEGDHWRPGAGPDPWPAFMEGAALEVADGWILEAEGEKCVGIALEGGAAAISQPGHAHRTEQISDRYRRLQAAGVAGVVYLADNDAKGQCRAAEAQAAADLIGLPFRLLPAITVWPDMPAGGSIDDAPGTPAERIAAIETALATAPEPPEPAATAEAAATNGRRHRLSPDEVLALLPQRLGRLRLNVRTGDIHTDSGVLSANQIGRLYLELSSATAVWPKDTTIDAVALLAHRDQFDPVRDYLEANTAPPLPLDQWHRLDQLLLGTDDPIARSFLPRFLISAVARTFEPGCDVRQSPVLIGPQWRGKTALGRILFGADQWVEGVGALDRDALQRAHTAWGVELAELDGVSRRRDQEQLKAFLTETCDVYRIAYDRAPERHRRRFVFWGTANRPPLRDATGSTRFVCIPIPDRMLPLDWVRQHRDALWARAVEQYRAGVPWDQPTEAERQAIAARNDEFTELDTWSEPIGRFLNERQQAGHLPVTVGELLTELEVPLERQTNAVARRAREIAEAKGWVHARRRWLGGEKAQGLWPPEPGHPDGHPGHPSGHPPGTPKDPSNANGSSPLGTPDIPKEEKRKTENSCNTPTACADDSARVFTPPGCPECPPHQIPSSASDLPGTAGVPIGVPIGVPGGVPGPRSVSKGHKTAAASRVACLLNGEPGWSRRLGPMRGLSVLLTDQNGRQLSADPREVVDVPPAGP